MATDTFAGPVDFLVFSFPEGASIGSGLSALLDQVNSGAIEVLDLELISRGEDGRPRTSALSALSGEEEIDLSIFEGIDSGILDADDLSAVADALAAGEFALVLVYEDRALARAASLWAATGGKELFSGGVAIHDLEHMITQGTTP